MSTFYIDESTGSDEQGKGSQEQPYKSLSFAIFSAAGLEDSKYLIRKDSTLEFDEPTKSGLKKAIKDAEGLAKKKKKAEEAAAQDASKEKAEKEKREKLLEDSKQIVLKENEDLPKAVKVRDYTVFVDNFIDFDFVCRPRLSTQSR